MKKYSLSEIMTTSELAQKLEYNQAYVLRLVKEILTEGVDYRSAGRRNYLFTNDALTKLQEHLNQTT
ncbi:MULTISPECIES: hypothetical protein [Bacillus]|uniref:hypothetical protein n=1 Tax=Bacillus TaxID=1386 RepID=UPI001B34102D|nr:hypothetical protein [Bacillus altitudinis]QTV11376.1 hypothetical protein J9319_13370 [Bacillus altitudinis]